MKIYRFVLLLLLTVSFGYLQAMPEGQTKGAVSTDSKYQFLEPLVGQWETSAKISSGPAAPASGTAEGKWTLGGKFLSIESAANPTDKSALDIKMIGYDELEKKYQAVWMDTDHTEMLQMKGVSNDGKKIIFLATSHNAAGQAAIARAVLTITDKDHHTWERYAVGADGKETKILEVAFSRKK
jgi:hypothetical protein